MGISWNPSPGRSGTGVAVAVALSLLMTCLPAGPAPAALADEAFASLFGREAAQVAASADKRDDVVFARKLIDAAGGVKDDRPLQALLYHRACDFALAHPDGYPAAAEAMHALAKAQPGERARADERLIAVYERQYRAAPPAGRKAAGQTYLAKLLAVAEAKVGAGQREAALPLFRQAMPVAAATDPDAATAVSSKVGRLTALIAAAKRVEELMVAVKAAPAERKFAAELVQVLVVDLDRPHDARPYAEAAGDPAVQRVVSLAAKDATELSGPEAAELGDWYRAQLARATDAGRAVAAARARACYERAVAVHGREDAQLLRIKLALGDLPPPPPGGPGWGTGPTTRPAPKGKVLLVIDDAREASTASAACAKYGLASDRIDRWDVARKDYAGYHTIVSGRNRMDDWAAGDAKQPGAFAAVEAFVAGGGHLVVFGTWNGRNLDPLRPFGITAGFHHAEYFVPVPGQTALLVKGNEESVPTDRRMRSVGSFTCSAPSHVVLLSRAKDADAAADGPAMVTLTHGKGRVTFCLVQPGWEPRGKEQAAAGGHDAVWLLTSTLSWISRGCPTAPK